MAEEMLNKLVLWAILIIFIIIFIFVFYNPKEGFMGKVSKLALAVERFLPFGRGEQVKPDTSLQQSTITAQERFMKEFSSYYDKEKCLLSFSSLADLEKFSMELSNYDGKVTSRIEKSTGSEAGMKLNPVSSGDNELRMCVISAEAFYNCYLAGSKDCTKITYSEKNFVKLTKDSITIDGNAYTLGQGLLFKPEKSKVCFIPVHKSTGDSWYKFWQIFTKWGCEAGKSTIDDDCLEKIKKEIPSC